VSVRQIVGDVRDRSPIVVDDMVSTGATVVAAMNALLAAGARRATTVVATHGLFVGRADEILLPLELEAVITTDSVTQHRNRLPMEVRTLGPLLAEVVRRLHVGAPLDGIHDLVRYRAQEAPAG
jgi:ribose-phosphate pyrophosphokinase